MSAQYAAAQNTRFPPNANPDQLRLPPIRELDLKGHQGSAPTDGVSTPQNHPTRYSHQWSRQSHSVPHQQHTPPLSAGHEASVPKVEYSSKHPPASYLQPGVPLQPQVNPITNSLNMGPSSRNEDPPRSPGQSKRTRTSSASIHVPRDARPSHNSYTPYASYQSSQPPPTSPYHHITQTLPPSHPPPLPPHDQIHNHQPPHTTYAYQQQYIHSRPQHPNHQPQPAPANPYPSPGPPPSAPPLQGPWGQTHHHQPQPSQHHAPQPSQHHPQHHHQHHPVPPPQPPPQPQQHQQQQHNSHLHPHQPLPSHSHVVSHHHQPQPPQVMTPQPQLHAQQQQTQQQHQQHQQQHLIQHQTQPPFTRTTAIVPTNIETRPSYGAVELERVPSARNDTLSAIAKHCGALYSFASRYAQIQSNMPHAQPPQDELAEMSQRAITVVRLLEEYRRMNLPEAERAKLLNDPGRVSPDDSRPPKRPWEDMSQDGVTPLAESSGFPDHAPGANDKLQTTAEQDMEIIRTKRATSAAGANSSAGQPKSKYRKRSRATPPGKCHSCNIRETPEWRRGPDGARTLCNACGLHYAKLMRKRDKANGNGDLPRIDLETLRASARAADVSDKTQSRKGVSRSNQSIEPASPMETGQPPQHHQGSFQLVSMLPQESAISSESNSQPAHQNTAPPPGSLTVPPPPWATSVAPTSGRGYPPEHLQHQSFMRSSQHPSSAAHTSPR